MRLRPTWPANYMQSCHIVINRSDYDSECTATSTLGSKNMLLNKHVKRILIILVVKLEYSAYSAFGPCYWPSSKPFLDTVWELTQERYSFFGKCMHVIIFFERSREINGMYGKELTGVFRAKELVLTLVNLWVNFPLKYPISFTDSERGTWPRNRERSDFNVGFFPHSSLRKCLHNIIKTQLCLDINCISTLFIATVWITGHQNWWYWKLK